MVQKIIMPSGGQTTDEMLIQRWNKNPGDPVKKGDILFEIETDKASMPVESFAEGTLLAILFKEGELVKAGEIVAYIGDPGDEITAQPEKQGHKRESEEIEQTFSQDDTTGNLIPGSSQQQKDLKIIFASPLAKNKAKIENINI